MKLYFTRHGQVSPVSGYINGDYRYPIGEVALSELGREQARLLGEELKKRGFHGVIFSSPYLRTMETSEILAGVLDTVIYPLPHMRERFMNENTAKVFVGSTLETLKQLFPHTAPDAALPDHWWGENCLETEADVDVRIRKGFESFPFEKYKDGDLLFVGHGASVGHSVTYFKIPYVPGRRLYNCCLSMTPLWEDSEPYIYDTSFFPEDMITANSKTKAMLDEEEKARKAEEAAKGGK